MFLAFQYPVEIPGVNNTYFLRAALNAQRKFRGEDELDSMRFLKLVREKKMEPKDAVVMVNKNALAMLQTLRKRTLAKAEGGK